MKQQQPQLGGDRYRQISGAEPGLSVGRVLQEALVLLEQAATRDLAVDTLAQLRDAAIPSLINRLHHPEPAVRHGAAWALSRVTDRRAAKKLIRAAQWTYPHVESPEPGSVRRLIHSMQIGTVGTRTVAAVALGRLGDPRAVPDLIELLRAAPPLPRLGAIWALGHLKNPDAVPHLADALHDPDSRIADLAADALSQINTPQARSALASANKLDE